jgi:TetR/AcrR family transcriptional regulator
MATWKNTVPSRDALYEAKREALLREAAAAFNRMGFHATSLDDIARNLGVTKAALYHYFPNKHALLHACFGHAMAACFRNLERARGEGANGRERLRLTLRYYLGEMIDRLSCCVALMEENALLPKDRADIVAERDRFEQALRQLVRDGIADGSIVKCDPKLVVFAMLGTINWVPKWFRHDGAWSAEQLAAALTDLLDRMLSSVPAPALAADVRTLGQ